MRKVAEHIVNLMLKQRLSLDSHPHQSLNSTWLPRFCAKKTAGTGIFNSGVVATAEGGKIALFFTGRQHAGENLAEVLKRRAAELPDSDVECVVAQSPKPIKLLVGNCLVHGRRQFVQIHP